jgi:hypothetical protein
MHQIYRITVLCLCCWITAAQCVTAEIGQSAQEVMSDKKKNEIREVIKDEAKNKQIRSNVKHLSLSERQTLRQQIRLQQTTQKPKKTPQP